MSRDTAMSYKTLTYTAERAHNGRTLTVVRDGGREIFRYTSKMFGGDRLRGMLRVHGFKLIGNPNPEEMSLAVEVLGGESLTFEIRLDAEVMNSRGAVTHFPIHTEGFDPKTLVRQVRKEFGAAVLGFSYDADTCRGTMRIIPRRDPYGHCVVDERVLDAAKKFMTDCKVKFPTAMDATPRREHWGGFTTIWETGTDGDGFCRHNNMNGDHVHAETREIFPKCVECGYVAETGTGRTAPCLDCKGKGYVELFTSRDNCTTCKGRG